MIFAALLTVTLGFPAQALELSAYKGPQDSAASDTTTSAAAAAPAAPLQSLPSSAAATATIQRDGFTVADAPKPVPVPVAAAPAASAASPVAEGGAVRWPFPGSVRLSGPYGPREAPCGGCSTFHKGLDMLPGEGAPAHSVADGVVREVSATDNGGFGVYAIVDHTIDGQLVSSVYAHFQSGSLQVSEGQSVGVGTHLGNVGNTGQSTGAHLHFEILIGGVTPTDPYAWLSERAGPM